MQVGAYTVTRELGRGGMGVVYEVRHPDWPDAPLALKLIRTDMADATATARFQREAEVMARIEHPNVVRVRTMGMFDEQLFLVTDLVPGEPLSERLRLGPLPPKQAVAIVRALSGALTAVHAEGVLHRDLKPANVIVRPDGTPVLLDFGVALDQGADKLTQTGAMIGTPSYMSPEQAAGERGRMGPHSDIYALGAILFALLSGRPPFQADSSMVVVKKILTEDPRWPSSDDEGMPLSLEAVLRKAMAKEPHQRYRTAEALSADLARWEAGEQPLAFETFQRELRRRRWPWAVVAGGVAVSVAAVGAAVTRTPDPSATATARPKPRPTRTAPKLDPVAELRRLRGVGGPRKVELARAFLKAFPDHSQAPGVRRELLQTGLTASVRVGEVEYAGQPWGAFLGFDRLVFVPRVYGGAQRPLMLWDLAAQKGRVTGPTFKPSERSEMEAVALHQGALALGLTETGLLRFDPTLATRGPDRAGRRSHVRGLAARGPWLAIGFGDGAVSLRKGAELKPGPTIAGHGDLPNLDRPVYGIGFSADGSRLWTASGEDRSVIRVWSTADGSRLHERRFDKDEIHVVEAHPSDPETMLLGAHDTNRMYLVRGLKAEPEPFPGSDLRAMTARGSHSSHLRGAAFSPDGTRIYSVSGMKGIPRTSELRVWDARTRKELVPPIRRPGLILFGLALSPDGAQLVTLGQKAGGELSVIELWEVDRPEPSP